MCLHMKAWRMSIKTVLSAMCVLLITWAAATLLYATRRRRLRVPAGWKGCNFINFYQAYLQQCDYCMSYNVLTGRCGGLANHQHSLQHETIVRETRL